MSEVGLVGRGKANLEAGNAVDHLHQIGAHPWVILHQNKIDFPVHSTFETLSAGLGSLQIEVDLSSKCGITVSSATVINVVNVNRNLN